MRPILSLDYQLESLYLWGLSASYLILWLEIYRGFLSFYSFWTILWQHCFVALIYVWVVANVFTSILIMRFISPFQALCVCVWGGGLWGVVGCIQGWELGVRTPHLPRYFILMVSFSDTLHVVSILDIMRVLKVVLRIQWRFIFAMFILC